MSTNFNKRSGRRPAAITPSRTGAGGRAHCRRTRAIEHLRRLEAIAIQRAKAGKAIGGGLRRAIRTAAQRAGIEL